MKQTESITQFSNKSNNLKTNNIMPTTEYRIYVKGILSFVKFTQKEFQRVCSDMDKLSVNYTTEIVSLI